MFHVYVTDEGDALVSVNPEGVYAVYTLHCSHPVYVGPSEREAAHSIGMSEREWDDLLDTRSFALADDLFCTGMPAYCNAECPLPRRSP